MNMREAQAMETKLKLLQSARTLFAEKGYGAASVREINRGVGLADGILYHYFPGGKRELFRVIVEENVQQILSEFSNRKDVDTYLNMPIEEVLESAYLRFTDIINEHIDIIRIMFRENEVRNIITKEEILKFSSGNEPWFKNLLQRKYEQGEIRKIDFESAAIAMDTLLWNHVMTVALGLGNGKIGNEEIRRNVFKYFVDMWKNSEV